MLLNGHDHHSMSTDRHVPFRGFDPYGEVRTARRRLPHWRQPGGSYFVTFRLGDSVPQPFCVSGGTNVLFGSDCIRNHGELANSANTKRALSAACRNGSMPAWVLATCGGLMCARKSKFVCCNSTGTVMTLTRLF